MNLAAANPGQQVGDGPADWVVNFELFSSLFSATIAIVLGHPVAAIFLFWFVDFEQIFGIQFSKTKTMLVQKPLCFCFTLPESSYFPVVFLNDVMSFWVV